MVATPSDASKVKLPEEKVDDSSDKYFTSPCLAASHPTPGQTLVAYGRTAQRYNSNKVLSRLSSNNSCCRQGDIE
jgi:hypothetical protein